MSLSKDAEHDPLANLYQNRVSNLESSKGIKKYPLGFAGTLRSENSSNYPNQRSPVTNNSEKGICVVNRQNDEWFVKKIDFKPFEVEGSMQRLRLDK